MQKRYFFGGLSLGLTLSISACLGPSSQPSPLSALSGQLSGALNRSQHPSSAQLQPVKFIVDLPKAGFKTQQFATAQYAKLEVWNKYNLTNNFTELPFPLYASGADAEGFVPIEGNQFILGAEVPEGINWLVTVRLYSTNSEESEIQQLKSVFHVPNTGPVIINHRTTVVGRILESLQTTNSPVVLRHEPGAFPHREILGSGSTPYIMGQIPFDITGAQAFADAFLGIDSAALGTPEFPESLPSENNPELQLPLNNSLVRFERIEALTPLPELSENCTQLPLPESCQAASPPVSLADINFFKLADDLSDGTIEEDGSLTGSTLTLTAASGQQADPADYRFPLYLVDDLRLQQKDTTGSTLALNPTTNRLFLHNRVLDIQVRDPKETLQAVDLNPDGTFGQMIFRQDLNRIDSTYPALGYSKAPDGSGGCSNDDDGPSVAALFLLTRHPITQTPPAGSDAGPAKLMALRQDDLSTLWEFDFGANMSESFFSPVLDREGSLCSPNDAIYTAINANTLAKRGVYKVRNGQQIAFAPLFKHHPQAGAITEYHPDGSGNTLPAPLGQIIFTAGGAISTTAYEDPLYGFQGEILAGQYTEPGKRLFVLAGGGSSHRSEFIAVDLNETNADEYGLRRLRFPLPENEQVHRNASPVIDTDGIVYFTTYSASGGNAWGHVYAYNPGLYPPGNRLKKLFSTQPRVAPPGQVTYPPTLAKIKGETHIYITNRYGEVYSLKKGSNWGHALTQNWVASIGRLAGPTSVFGPPDVIQRSGPDDLTLYVASSSIDGRIYEIDPVSGDIRSIMFPGGFFSAGTIVHNNHMYVTTRSGNYGDFTYLRSLKVEGSLAPKNVSAWPKTGGNYANSGNFKAPVF